MVEIDGVELVEDEPKIYIRRNISERSLLVGVGLKSNDVEGKIGAAHLLEHLLFKHGDSNYSTNNSTNSFVTPYSTIYTAELYDDFEKNLKIIFGNIANPIFDKKIMEIEKKRIEHEILGEVDDPRLFGRRNFLSLIHGITLDYRDYTKSIRKMTADDLMDIYKKYYNLDNVLIYAAIPDNLNEKSVVSTIRELFRNMERGEAYNINFEDISKRRKRYDIDSKSGLQLSYLFIGFEGPGIDFKDFPDFFVTSNILNKYLKRPTSGKANVYYISYDTETFLEINRSLFHFMIPFNKKGDLESALLLIEESVGNLKREKIGENILNDVKLETSKIYENLLSDNNLEQVEDMLTLLLFDRKYDKKRFRDRIEEIDENDINKVLKEYFNKENKFVYLLQPNSKINRFINQYSLTNSLLSFSF